jgi:hypothetical protein
MDREVYGQKSVVFTGKDASNFNANKIQSDLRIITPYVVTPLYKHQFL